MNMQSMDRGGRGGMGGGYAGAGGRGYQGRVNMPDYGGQSQQQYGGQQVFNPQAYGGPRGVASPPVGGGYGATRYPAGYGGTAAVVGMSRGVPGAGGYPTSQIYTQQAQPIGYYGYGFRYVTNALPQ